MADRVEADDEDDDDEVAGPGELSPEQQALSATLGTIIEDQLRAGGMPAEDAVGVLCAITANLISMDPSAVRGAAAVRACTAALEQETARLRRFRAATDARYRAAMETEG